MTMLEIQNWHQLSMFDVMVAPVWVFDIDDPGVLYGNAAACKLVRQNHT